MEIGFCRKEKVEQGETLEQAALREVSEESGVKGQIQEYLGEIHYTYKENWDENRMVHKTVHWYLMTCKDMNTLPQKEEGFVEAKFIHSIKCFSWHVMMMKVLSLELLWKN